MAMHRDGNAGEKVSATWINRRQATAVLLASAAVVLVLRGMVLRDSFGQTTLLRFNSFERNPKLDDAQFRFTPPAGADVIGDDAKK